MEKKSYLDISKAGDLSNKKERALYRFFEILPGAISLGTLVGVFIFSWFWPSVVSMFIIGYCFYYLLRIFYFSLHQIVAYFRVKSHLKIDWMEKLKREKGKKWKDIYHVIVLPTYKEGSAIIRESLNSLIASDYPKEKMIVVLAQEERAGEIFITESQALAKEYAGKFFDFIVSVHPGNIVGELAGKGANIAYTEPMVKDLVDKAGILPEDIIVSVFDIDTKAYPKYFACLTWYYLTEKNPTRASYQPVPVYNNNIWKATFFARVVSTSNTFWQMIQQERSEKLTTYSSHAVSGNVFFDIGYPKNVVPDDSRIFWRAYLQYDGDYRVVPIYYLVSMDAVDTNSIFKTIINQYKQQRRWAWGCVEIPYVIFGFLKNKNISIWAKIAHVYTLIDGYWSWATAALLLFMLGWLPILLGGNKFNFTVLSFNLPILTGRIMTISLIGMFISAILSTMILPEVPRGVSRLKRISVFLQWIFLPVTLIVFGAFPSLDAQIRLMLGKHMGFWVTDKVRK